MHNMINMHVLGVCTFGIKSQHSLLEMAASSQAYTYLFTQPEIV